MGRGWLRGGGGGRRGGGRREVFAAKGTFLFLQHGWSLAAGNEECWEVWFLQ